MDEILSEIANVMNRVARVTTYLVQYTFMLIAVIMGYMFERGIEYRDVVVVEDSAYFLIVPVLLQLIPVAIRYLHDWKVSWATLLVLSIQFVYANYLRILYHHFVSKEAEWALFFTVFLTISLVLSLFFFYKMAVDLAKALSLGWRLKQEELWHRTQ